MLTFYSQEASIFYFIQYGSLLIRTRTPYFTPGMSLCQKIDNRKVGLGAYVPVASFGFGFSLTLEPSQNYGNSGRPAAASAESRSLTSSRSPYIEGEDAPFESYPGSPRQEKPTLKRGLLIRLAPHSRLVQTIDVVANNEVHGCKRWCK